MAILPCFVAFITWYGWYVEYLLRNKIWLQNSKYNLSGYFVHRNILRPTRLSVHISKTCQENGCGTCDWRFQEWLLAMLDQITERNPAMYFPCWDQGFYSLSGRTSYRNISWSLEAAWFAFDFSKSCWDACQISEEYDHYNIQSRGFETSRDLAVRCLTSWWIEAQNILGVLGQ